MAHFFFIFHALSFELNFFIDRSFPLRPVHTMPFVVTACSIYTTDITSCEHKDRNSLCQVTQRNLVVTRCTV